MKKIILMSSLLFLLVNNAIASSQEEYALLLIATKDAHKAAIKAEGEWEQVAEMIKKAARLARNARYENAVELLKTAKAHSEMGLEQAQSQINVGNPDYLKPTK